LWRGEENIRLWRGKLGERDQLEDLGVDGRIILKHIFKKRDVGINWNDLVQDRARRRATFNVVMNLQFS